MDHSATTWPRPPPMLPVPPAGPVGPAVPLLGRSVTTRVLVQDQVRVGAAVALPVTTSPPIGVSTSPVAARYLLPGRTIKLIVDRAPTLPLCPVRLPILQVCTVSVVVYSVCVNQSLFVYSRCRQGWRCRVRWRVREQPGLGPGPAFWNESHCA